MPEIPGENQTVREVSVDELERYLNGLESRFEARSSFTILKISFSRLKIQDLDAKGILKGMLHFFEAAQKGDVRKNDVYRELLNLYDELFFDASVDGLPTGIPPSAGYPPRSSGVIFPDSAEVSGEHMNPTIKPPDFAGGSLRAMMRMGTADRMERSKAETLRPSQEPAADLPATGTDETATDDINARETLPDIDQTALKKMMALLAAPTEMPEIETGEVDAADLGLPEEEVGDAESARDSENPGST